MYDLFQMLEVFSGYEHCFVLKDVSKRTSFKEKPLELIQRSQNDREEFKKTQFKKNGILKIWNLFTISYKDQEDVNNFRKSLHASWMNFYFWQKQLEFTSCWSQVCWTELDLLNYKCRVCQRALNLS